MSNHTSRDICNHVIYNNLNCRITLLGYAHSPHFGTRLDLGELHFKLISSDWQSYIVLRFL